MADRPYRYPAAVRGIHWLAAALVAVAYLTSESAEDIEELAAGAVNWHVLSGLVLMLLFIPRVVGYWWIRPPPPTGSSAAATWMARAVHLSLLLFIVVEPLLGVLMVWAEGNPVPIPLTSWNLPPLLVLGGLEETLEDLHEDIGNVFYAVIGLHVFASLWHHFVRRDDVLRRML